MAVVTSTKDWSGAVTPAAKEIWQVQSGTIRVTASGPTGRNNDDGILVSAPGAIEIGASKTVYHRAVNAGPSGTAVFTREALN